MHFEAAPYVGEADTREVQLQLVHRPLMISGPAVLGNRPERKHVRLLLLAGAGTIFWGGSDCWLVALWVAVLEVGVGDYLKRSGQALRLGANEDWSEERSYGKPKLGELEA